MPIQLGRLFGELFDIRIFIGGRPLIPREGIQFEPTLDPFSPPNLPFKPPPTRVPPTVPGTIPGQTPPIFGPGTTPKVPKLPPSILTKLGRRIPGLGGLIIIAAEVLVKVVEKAQLDTMADILIGQDIQIGEIVRKTLERKARERLEGEIDLRVRKLLEAPETLEPQRASPEPEILPPRPAEVLTDFEALALPRLAIPRPEIQTDVDVPAPELPLPQPSPTIPETFPDAPVEIPSRVRTPLEILIPDRVAFPRSPLTDIEAVSVGSVPAQVLDQVNALIRRMSLAPDFAEDLQTEFAPARKECKPTVCEDELDEPRIQCFKGLYRERRTSTDFTKWVEIDCETGRESGTILGI